MTSIRSWIASAVVLMVAVNPASASESEVREKLKAGEFEAVLSDVKSAIVNRGYVVDYVGHLNKMLERTSEAVGSVTDSGAKSPYKDAQYLQFCAAKLTHEAISANPQSIVNCPYVVYVYELNAKPGSVHVGYRPPLSGPSKRSKAASEAIGKLLEDIVKEATE
ncbi:MAG: DUF302 domain-containing protein [Hyphomicrobiaceae bacterium]